MKSNRTSTVSNSNQLYDLTMVNKMSRGNEKFAIKMVAVFISQISQSVQEITEASQIKDVKKIKQEIHRVKPTLAYYGTYKIEKELLILEKLIIETSTAEELKTTINTLSKITTQTIAKMKIDFGI